MVDPIVYALNLMQAENRSLGESVEIWLELLQHVPPASDTKKLALERACILSDPRALVCNLLNHRFHGRSLSDPQRCLASDWVHQNLGHPVGCQLDTYMAMATPFRPGLLEQHTPPDVWWMAGRQKGFPEELCNLGVRCSACRATTADLERAFSTAGNTFGRRRQRLGVQRASQLAFIWRQLRRQMPSTIESEDED